MRSISFLFLALLAVPLAAQNFEGTLVTTVTGDQPQLLNWSVKGPLKIGSRVSKDGVASNTILVDDTAKTTTSFLLYPNGALIMGKNGIAKVSSLLPVAGATPTSGPRKLSTSQSIAGFKCDDYDIGDADHTHACLSSDLGTFVYPGSIATAARGGGGTPTVGAPANSGRGGTVNSPPSDCSQTTTSFIPPDPTQAARVIASVIQRSESGLGAPICTLTLATGSTPMMELVQNSPEDMRALAAANPSAAGAPQRAGAAGGIAPAPLVTPGRAAPLRGAAFPLRVWKTDGTVLFEITDVQHIGISDNIFVIPEQFTVVKSP